MHELDRWKVMRAGFTLWRCSESEFCIKRRRAGDRSWTIQSRHGTKKAIEDIHKQLLEDPKAIQD